MRKRMKKAFMAMILMIGMFIGCVTPVFAGQVGQSFRFTLKNRTNISVTVEVTFEIFQDYVTTTPYSTTKKTYTVAANGQTDCWSMGSLSGGKTAAKVNVKTSGVKASKYSNIGWYDTVYLDMSGIDITFRNVGSVPVNFTVKTGKVPNGKNTTLSPGGSTVMSIDYNSYYNITSMSANSGYTAYISKGSQSLSNITSNKEVQFSTKAAEKKYTVVFNGNGNTGGSMSNQTFTVGVSQKLTKNAFTKTGYSFAGWATSASGSAVYSDQQSVKDLSTTNGATVNLYAKWNVNTYTIKYDANGGSGAPGNQTKTYGVNLTLSSTKPTRGNSTANKNVTFDGNGGSTGATNDKVGFTVTTKYTFSKWNTSANGSGTNYNSGGTYSANSGATLYAQYSTEKTIGTVKLPTPSRSGYSFDGWFTAKTGGTKRGGAGDTYTPPENGETLYAHWTQTEFTVSYDANGGTSAPNSQKKTKGVDLTLSSTKPTKSDSVNPSVVYFDANGGSSTGAQNDRISFRITHKYTFSKWNTKADGSGTNYSSGGTYKKDADVVMYAQYTDTTSSSTITLPRPTRTGYTFDGWYTAKTGGTKVGTANSPYAPKQAGETLYAHWTPIQYRITYILDGGTNHPDNPATYTIEDAVTLKAPTRTGYEFVSWTPAGSIAKGSTGSKVFTANWRVITRNIIVKKDNKSYNDTVKILVDGTAYTVNVPSGSESKSVAVPIGHEVKVTDATTTSDKELRVDPMVIPAGNDDATILVTHIDKDTEAPKVTNYKLNPDAFGNTTYYPTSSAVTYSPANTDSNIELDAKFFTNGTVTVTAHITDNQSGIKEVNLLNRSNSKIRTIKTFTSNFLEQTLSADVTFSISSRLLITDGYKIQVIDGAGNKANYMLIVPQIDKVKPSIQSVTTDSSSITIKVSDDYSGVASWQYRVKLASTGYDTGWLAGDTDPRITRIPIVNEATVNASGTYSALLSVKITDRAGNVYETESDLVIELGKHYLSNGDLIDYDYIFAKYDSMFGKGAVLNTTRANRFYNFLVSDTANASKAVKRFVDQKMDSGMSKVEALQYFFDIFNYNQH
ncbi:MAG: InlB B-repeat-containing protein [Erysipelotrichaceae bacterium]|nr:InlB B-repeat-containing protein [Erysipelotrichaceae bacterium]